MRAYNRLKVSKNTGTDTCSPRRFPSNRRVASRLFRVEVSYNIYYERIIYILNYIKKIMAARIVIGYIYACIIIYSHRCVCVYYFYIIVYYTNILLYFHYCLPLPPGHSGLLVFAVELVSTTRYR